MDKKQKLFEIVCSVKDGTKHTRECALVRAEDIESAIRKIKDTFSGFGHDCRIDEVTSARLFYGEVFTLRHGVFESAVKNPAYKMYRIGFEADNGLSHNSDVAVVLATSQAEAKRRLESYIQSRFYDGVVENICSIAEFTGDILCLPHGGKSTTTT